MFSDVSPVRYGNRNSSSSSVETNFYNLSDQIIIVDKSMPPCNQSEDTPIARRISLHNSFTPPQETYNSSRKNRGGSLEKEYQVYREKRNPLLDKVKNTKLSCFKSNGPLHYGDDAASTSGSECSRFGHPEDVAHCRYDSNYPGGHIEFENQNPWVKMPNYDDDVFVTKSISHPNESHWREKNHSILEEQDATALARNVIVITLYQKLVQNYRNQVIKFLTMIMKLTMAHKLQLF